jgi:hypothetical protein
MGVDLLLMMAILVPTGKKKNLYKRGQITKFSNHHDPLPPCPLVLHSSNSTVWLASHPQTCHQHRAVQDGMLGATVGVRFIRGAEGIEGASARCGRIRRDGLWKIIPRIVVDNQL